MSDNLPSNLFSGGAVVFNSQPYTQFYLQSQARKRAKDEALTNYFSNFTRSINPAGMRTQDIEGGWMQKRNDWEKYYYENADKIKNPKLDSGKSYNEYMSRYQDILNDTQRSKNAAESISKIIPIISDPEKRTRLAESSLTAIHNADKSIYDPTHKPVDYAEINYDPKQLDASTLKGYNDYFTNGLKMSEAIPTVTIDPKTKSKISVTKSAYKPEDINIIASRAEGLYQSNHAFKAMIDGMDNPSDYERLNRVFKDVYGHDVDIKHPEELATAWALGNTQHGVTNTALQTFSPTHISINNSSGQKSKGWVLDLADAAASGDPVAVQNVASQLFAGNNDAIKLERTHVQNGTIWFDYKQYEYKKDKNGNVVNDAAGKPIPEWKKHVAGWELGKIHQPEALAKLGNLEQKFFGSTQKAESTPYYMPSKNTSKKSNKKIDPLGIF